jgi:hypothetical protein
MDQTVFLSIAEVVDNGLPQQLLNKKNCFRFVLFFCEQVEYLLVLELGVNLLFRLDLRLRLAARVVII